MPRRLRVLHAIHDFLPRHQAGSEIYAAALCQALQRRGHHVTVLAASSIRRDGTARSSGECTTGFPSSRSSTTGRSIRSRRPIARRTCDRSSITCCARRSRTCCTSTICSICPSTCHSRRARAARASSATLHDYTLVCPSGGQRIHRAEQHVCHTIEPDRCARCFAQSPYPPQMAFGRTLERPGGRLRTSTRADAAAARAATAGAARPLPPADGDQRSIRPPRRSTARLDAARAVAAEFDLLVGPSQSIASEFSALGIATTSVWKSRTTGFGQLADRPAAHATAGPLRVGFVGTLVWHKGVHVLIDAVRQMPAGHFDALIFGDTDTFPDYTAELRASARSLPVRFMGRFERDCTRRGLLAVRRARRPVAVARELAAGHSRSLHGRRAGDWRADRRHQRSRPPWRERFALPTRLIVGAGRRLGQPGDGSRTGCMRFVRTSRRRSDRSKMTQRTGSVVTSRSWRSARTGQASIVSQPLVSIVIPTRNGGPRLKAVIDAVRRQRFAPMPELVIVDSGSTDGSRSSCDRCRRRLHRDRAWRLQPRHHPQSRGGTLPRRVVVMLVQDALPQGDLWLASLVDAARSATRRLPGRSRDRFRVTTPRR